MECLVDESYVCKSNRINNTLDCAESECTHYKKISEYYKNKKKVKSDSKNGMDQIFFRNCGAS
jgi:hypothetical protein